MNNKLIEFLSEFITENRKQKFIEVLQFRTRHLAIVLEDIFQPQNASAVLRTCDCFGVQDVHVIENRNKYNINPDVVLGASDWLNITRYNKTNDNTAECLNALKQKGYKIAATSLNEKSISIHELDLNPKTALVFGTELTGISEAVKEQADCFVKIPMYGFTESFNISVSAALCMQAIVPRLHKSDINWKLSDKEREEVLLEWIRKSIHKPELLEEEFYKRMKL